MRFKTTQFDGGTFLEWADESSRMEEPLDVVTACVEHDTNLLLIDSSHLPDDFFDLSTGFAGEFLQKMQNYRVRVAAVIPTDESYSQRFREFLSEARSGSTFRAFDDRASAEVWLAGE